jgi:diguanylate cyclase (GGDEF)-like protein
VDSPDRCPAARRAQVQVFSDSEDLDACPKLRARPQGRLSAMCVPVSIMGRTVGVIHATGEPGAEVDESQRHDLTTLAKLAGARIGLLRVMAETQLQASTDTLTGLLNRRSFSEQVASIPEHMHPVAMAMADLDHFKKLNDTYGHETGDRALRLFARVVRDSLRTSDLVSRYGGEEFAIAFPDCSAIDAMRALDTVRSQLDAAITVGGLPKFTASFGITDTEPGDDLAAAMRRADDALMVAKRQGRDRVVLHDPLANAGAAATTNGNGNGHRNGNGNGHVPALGGDAGLGAAGAKGNAATRAAATIAAAGDPEHTEATAAAEVNEAALPRSRAYEFEATDD